MTASEAITTIDAAFQWEGITPALDAEQVREIGEVLEAVGEYPGMIGETLVGFREWVAALHHAHRAADDEFIDLASLHLRDTWATLFPALSRLTAATLRKPEAGLAGTFLP